MNKPPTIQDLEALLKAIPKEEDMPKQIKIKIKEPPTCKHGIALFEDWCSGCKGSPGSKS